MMTMLLGADELTMWKTATLVLSVIVIALLLVIGYGLVRPKLVEIHSPQARRSRLDERLLGAQEGAILDEESGSSSLFSPPCRGDVDFKSAAANVGHTHNYIKPTVSAEDFTKLCMDNFDENDSPRARV